MAWFRTLVLALLTLVALGDARAADPEFESAWADVKKSLEPQEPPTFFENLDGAFGKFVVGPLATVMFFDVVVWDNDLPLGDGLGRYEQPDASDNEVSRPYVLQVSKFEAGRGYGRQKVYRSSDGAFELTPLLAEPKTVRIGPVSANLSTDRDGPKPIVRARIPVQNANLAALGVQAWDPASAELPEVSVFVPALGFPVTVDRRTLKLEPAAGPVPASVLNIEVGSRVYDNVSALEYEVVDGAKDDWVLRGDEADFSHDTLANPAQAKLPIVVLWLVLGAIFFTLRMGFINLRAFGHAIAVTMGRYDHEEDEGEISHFQALSSALSATVGLGNIAGVAIAISLGGPGAVFWLWVAGFLGMSSKFVECTLGQMYRETDASGAVSGGPMHYLDKGLAELGLGPLGKILAIVFALMCIGGSLGGGNMFQANQSFEAVAGVVPDLAPYAWLYGIMLMIVVGFVIIGGIKRIGAAASLVVPLMCGVYVLAGIYVLSVNITEVPAAFGRIVSQAFNPEAQYGGLIGVLAMGFQRASFSNEAGVGSASIAHSAASTAEPVREGIVALLEPFIDTLVVCTVTALVVVVTGVEIAPGSGIKATMDAFAGVLPWFPFVLAFAAMMFAFSTMVSWSYYGERCAVWLFGEMARMPYRGLFLICVFLGSVIKLGNVLDFSDLMILGMAFPNILGAVLLSSKVKRALDSYLERLRSGAFSTEP